MRTTKLPKVMSHGCARCGGDLFFEREEEEYICLQCGRATPKAALKRLTAAAVATVAPTEQDRDLVAA